MSRAVLDRYFARRVVVSARRNELCLVSMHTRRALPLVAKRVTASRLHLSLAFGSIAYEALSDTRASANFPTGLYQSVFVPLHTRSTLFRSSVVVSARQVHGLLAFGRQRLRPGRRTVQLERGTVEENLFLGRKWGGRSDTGPCAPIKIVPEVETPGDFSPSVLCRHGWVVGIICHKFNMLTSGRESRKLSGPKGRVHVGHEVGAIARVAHVKPKLRSIMPGESGKIPGSVPEFGEAAFENSSIWPMKCVTKVTNRNRIEFGATE